MVNLSIHSYCEADISISQIWINDTLSPCFYLTIISAILLLLTFLLGTRHCIIYKKYGTAIDPDSLPCSSSYIFQQALSAIILFQFVGFMMWRVLFGGELPGYVLFYGISGAVVWLWAMVLLRVERRRVLLRDKIKGYSTTLILIWTLALAAEAFLIIATVSPHSWDVETNKQLVENSLWYIRSLFSFMVLFIGVLAPGTPHKPYTLLLNDDEGEVEQSRPNLLGGPDQDQDQDQDQSTWQGIKMKVLVAFMWPEDNHWLQLLVLSCLGLLVAERVVNVFVPVFFKRVVDQLSDGTSYESLSITILFFILLKLLQGGGPSGMLSLVRSYLWSSVQRSTNSNVKLNVFQHLHCLSLRWHLQPETRDVLKSIDRGISCINSLTSYIIFGMVPTILDIIISIGYFCVNVSPFFSLIIFVNLTMHLGITIILTELRAKKKSTKPKEVDFSLNFETVKYYNTEDYEFSRYQDAISKLQVYESKSQKSLAISDQMYNFSIGWGLMAGCLYCARYVTEGKLQVGDFVLFGTYLIQLYAPLNWLGTYYREILDLFSDMEILIKLFHEEDMVKDDDNASDLIFRQGKVQFQNVCFSYISGEEILKDLSFTVQPGQTVALVGQSGSGRSTIIRLLLRLYDIQGGCIRIDGQDISKVKQTSLRAHIGVVPQDTVLFNDNFRDNIRYGRISASDQEVEQAAVAADIHDKIMAFPEGYETQVGERGLKLSGGEKQRVAIARTILKAPQIILLDEATSSLDTETERDIQASLGRVCAKRTTIVVAHRLSTIIEADQIYVLRDGCVAERGRHEELLAHGGLYADMWTKQQQV